MARFVNNLTCQYKQKDACLQELLNVAMLARQNAVMKYDVCSKDSLVRYAVLQMRDALVKI